VTLVSFKLSAAITKYVMNDYAMCIESYCYHSCLFMSTFQLWNICLFKF